MYKHYQNPFGDGSFSAEEVRRGLVALNTDYECPFCRKTQSIPQMGGYGARCIYCGKSSNPRIAAEEATK